MTYNWELSEWPNYRWDAGKLLAALEEARHKQGLLLGRMAGLGFRFKLEAEVDTLTEDVVKSSAIEGEDLSRPSVRSSIARRLGLPEAAATRADQKTEGVVEMMLDATQRFSEPLTEARLFGWHAALFPTGYSGMSKLRIAQWRDDALGPMQVVSGRLDKPKVHYEAPPASRVPADMARFLHWYEHEPEPSGLLRAGLAHLWFVTIHPFDDGNGRIARTIADQALSRMDQSSQRFYSMSSQIQEERRQYYDILERTQTSDLDITEWMLWFVQCFERAVIGADGLTQGVLARARFWQDRLGEEFSLRQRKLLDRMLSGFEGKMTAKKWAAIGKCSPPTALRDITDLIERGILVREEGGSKNSAYKLAPSNDPGGRPLVSDS
ncbi:MAG: Fic family protein [Fimbriimonas sp.]